MTQQKFFSIFLLLLGVAALNVRAFAPAKISHRARSVAIFNSEDPDVEKSTSAKMSLEEKMKSWEASEDEIKAATLGGVVPGEGDANRSDAFDIGLYIAFPLMVLSGLAFALFPFIMENLDVDSVGPPPTQ